MLIYSGRYDRNKKAVSKGLISLKLLFQAINSDLAKVQKLMAFFLPKTPF